MVSLDQAAHSRRPDRATLLLMNEGLPRQGILRSSVIHFHCKCFPARTPAPKCFLKFEFNGVDGLRTYISFTGSPLWSIRSFLMSNGAMKIAVALSIVLTPLPPHLREGEEDTGADTGDLRASQVRREREMCRSVVFRAAPRTPVD
jgi:hypothetical protein